MTLRTVNKIRTKNSPTCAGQSEMLAELLKANPVARTVRWRNAVKQEFAGKEAVVNLYDDFCGMLESINFVPDAYIINTEEGYLHFFEVEVFSPMSRHKLESYGKLVIDMSFYEIDFAVYTVNQHGHIHVVDLLPHYAKWLQAAQS